MRHAALLMLCLLCCSCSRDNGESVVAAENSSAQPPANDSPAGGNVENPLVTEIKAMQADMADFLATVRAASAEERSGSRRKEFMDRGFAMEKPFKDLSRRVAELNDEEVNEQWKNAEGEMQVMGSELAQLLGVEAENTRTKAVFEALTVGDLMASLNLIQSDDSKRRKLRADNVKDTQGRQFYEAAFNRKLLEDDLANKLVSLNSKTDKKADGLIFSDGDGTLEEFNCSFTAPIASELLSVMRRKGSERAVLITYNARNWNNFPTLGVIVQWSDAEKPVWMNFEEAQRDWGITAEEWADPAGKLFGKKAPFQHTYE
jgi:hypothetical protein